MIEDDGYETIVPDLSAVKVEKVDREAAEEWHHAYAMAVCGGRGDSPGLAELLARHRQEAYNQALKDAAEVVKTVIVQARCGDIDTDLRCVAHHLESRILSLGDKGNG